MAVSAQERRFLLNQASQLASSDVDALWSVAALSGAGFAQYVVDGFPDIVEPWIFAAADLAAVWFEETVPGPAIVADPIPVERLRASAQWALGADGTQGLQRLRHTTQRAVYDGARETTLANVKKTGIRWARDARPDACAFCRMLATRTTKLYRSRDKAATKVHDDCHCIPIEVVNPRRYTLSEHAQQWEDEYRKARANAGSGEPGKILSAWREQAATIK